jgi:SSS family solute:Na+ symporter
MSLIIISCLVYLTICILLGYLGYRQTKNAKDYLVGGKQIHPVIMALSYGSTFISTSAIVGFGGAAATFGMGLLWLTFLTIFVGVFIAFIVFGKRTRKIGHNLDASTFPEFLGKRFDSRFIQIFVGAVIFVLMPLYAAAVMIGATNFISTTFRMEYGLALILFVIIVAAYVWSGGMKGVMYTDAFQGGIMFAAMAFLIIFVYSKLGGITTAHEKLNALMSSSAVAESVAGSVKAGFRGWMSMPEAGSPFWWTLVSSVVMGVGIGALAQPQLAVRFLTVKSGRELNRAVPIGGIFIIMMTGVAFVVGALTNIFFFEDTGKIAAIAAGNKDNIIPLFINNYVPSWFSSIFLITMLAAAMSTLSSQFHTMGSAAGRDLYETGTGKRGNTLTATRIGMLAAIIISTLLAYLLPEFFGKNGLLIIATSTSLFFGICASTFLPIYAGALYFKGMPKKAAEWGMVSGFACSIFWIFFIHESESKALLLCKTLFGVDSLAALVGPAGNMIKMVDPIFVALPVSIIATIAFSLVFRQDLSPAHREKCFGSVGATIETVLQKQ